MAFFSNQPSVDPNEDTPPVTPQREKPRYVSDAPGSTDTRVAGNSNDSSLKEKNSGVAPTITNDSIGKHTDVERMNTLSTTEGPIQEVYNGKRDPFASGVEGGVHYKSMAWWYVKMSSLIKHLRTIHVRTDHFAGKPAWSWWLRRSLSVSSHFLGP